jgi:predicted RecA/RadA family phage recombinase
MKKFQVIALLALAAVASICYAVDPVMTANVLPGLFGHDLASGIAVSLPALAAIGATNYVQEGCTVTLTAPYTVVSGAGTLVGHVFGVALGDVTSGDEGEYATEGVFDLLAVTLDTFAVGALVYWDNSGKKCTSTSTGNSLIGVALAAKINTATTVRVRLDGVAV